MDTNSTTIEAAPVAPPPETVQATTANSVKPFRQAGFLAEAALRKIRERHEGFARALVARLSTYLRMDFGLELAGFRALSFQGFIERMVTPTHLTLFKAEPLRGIGVVEIPPKLGLAIVERLLGGSGSAENHAERALTEIETALLDQAVDVLVGEWCHQWHDLQQIKHTLLGHEIDGRFLNTATRTTTMLEILLEVTFGECKQQCRIGLPYNSLEPLIRRFDSENSSPAAQHTPATVSSMEWSPIFDEVPVAVAASIEGMQSTARQLANLKVGDTVPLDPHRLNQIQISLVNAPKFIGSLGKIDGRWAVKITQQLEN